MRLKSSWIIFRKKQKFMSNMMMSCITKNRSLDCSVIPYKMYKCTTVTYYKRVTLSNFWHHKCIAIEIHFKSMISLKKHVTQCTRMCLKWNSNLLRIANMFQFSLMCNAWEFSERRHRKITIKTLRGMSWLSIRILYNVIYRKNV